MSRYVTLDLFMPSEVIKTYLKNDVSVKIFKENNRCLFIRLKSLLFYGF